MIGRSLVIFQRGNNKNELHECNSWSFCLGLHDAPEDVDKRIVKESKKKKWKPEDVVSDAEVDAIVNATNCIGPKEPGYHKWASDGVHIINLSGDPNLYNPAVAKAERRRKEEEIRKQKIHKLQKFIPELAQLYKAVPEGKVTMEVTLKVKVEVQYIVCTPICTLNVLKKEKDGTEKDQMYASWLIDREKLAKRPEMERIINDPARIKYHDRCQEIAALLELSQDAVHDQASSAVHGYHYGCGCKGCRKQSDQNKKRVEKAKAKK